jgi:hypothetical protein
MQNKKRKNMKYTTENSIKEVLKVIPGFKTTWEEHLDDWDGESAGLILDMIELAGYTNSLLKKGETEETKLIFGLMESMLEEGENAVRNAVLTGFLETVINPVTKNTDYLPQLGSLLGEKSRTYVHEWLKFTGGDLPNI